MKPSLAVLFMAFFVAGCAPTAPAVRPPNATLTRHDAIEQLIATVREDRSKKPLLARAIMHGPVLIIPDPHEPSLAVLSFDQPERSFIPVFSDRTVFDDEAYGTGFEGKAISIDARQFASLLHGDEIVILDPGHRPAIEFRGSELKAAADQ